MSTLLGAISTTSALYLASEVDTLVAAASSNLDMKDTVVTVSTTNITLSGEQTINGVTTSASRIGVTGQTTASANGIYTTAAGAWVRTSDANSNATVTSGLSFFVGSSSTKAGNQYLLTTNDAITLGTTALTFTEIPKVSIASGAEVAAASEAGKAISPSNLNSISTVGTITVGVWNGTDVAIADGGTGSSTASGARTNLGLGTFATENIAAVPTVTFADAANIVINTTTGTKIGTGATQKIGFFGATPVVQSATYTVSNTTTDRTYDANATSVDEVADVLGTLIADLKLLGVIG